MSTPHVVATIEVEMQLVNASDTSALFQEGDDESSSLTMNIGVFLDSGSPESVSLTITLPTGDDE